MGGILYVVATPIGNLSDLTHRAEQTLQNVDLIAAEDTRTSRKLLNHYSIDTPLTSYHDKNEIRKAGELTTQLHGGKSVALISDAGTPCISDPGYRLVHAARKEGIEIVTIPGASAVTAALSVSGLPTDHFYFNGFLPPKKGRKTTFESLESLPATIVIFESPMRLFRTLTDLQSYWGDRIISVCRELTKMYEETFFGTVSEAIDYFSKSKVKGEIVILVAKKGYTL
ncbi:MAG: 16S rRNA (cytidine(1402)-2'-O)-methyltransferase [Candidatus Marinimicrobia bacterium]|nr:16S rRNA (cytidine(1402)-2'-O)-methyltransferase [Candidatus Neomarinimicrobiota bacterium]MDP6853104.1 16S rRNA (cytidine(1402)-2'-O)-methyltransferase [Candidatus Neomarinimicrobiota bacterium]MDP6936682.1 16S rRNA (cytidine(1402)-2'-O)-methyltransferase [Candidatus Neomarinimicrobiota bacterium]